MEMTSRGNEIRVFVIDDDVLVCDAICLMLRDAGFAVASANELTPALEEVATLTPEVIVTDLQMPGSQDADAVAALRRCFPTLPIIAVSGRPELEARARRYGADVFFAKPLRRGVLTDSIVALAHGAS